MTKEERAKKSHIPWIPYKDVTFFFNANSGYVDDANEAVEIANNAIIFHMYNEYSPD